MCLYGHLPGLERPLAEYFRVFQGFCGYGKVAQMTPFSLPGVGKRLAIELGIFIPQGFIYFEIQGVFAVTVPKGASPSTINCTNSFWLRILFPGQLGLLIGYSGLSLRFGPGLSSARLRKRHQWIRLVRLVKRLHRRLQKKCFPGAVP